VQRSSGLFRAQVWNPRIFAWWIAVNSIAFVLALLVSITAGAGPQAKPADAAGHVNFGDALSGKGDYDGAIAEYREALRLDPKSAEAHVGIGAALSRKGKWKEVIPEEAEALRLDPNNGAAHVGIGDVLRHLENWDEAITQYREALRLDPKNAEAHLGIGEVLRQRKRDWDGAIKEYREALSRDSNNERAHTYLGEALGAKGDYEGEIAEEREALRLDPDNKDARSNLDHALQAQRQAQKDEMSKKEVEDKSANIATLFVMSAIAGFVFGMFFSTKGLLIFRELRVIEDTPELPIRSIAMGLTHFHGKSQGEQTVPGPISKQPVFFYIVKIQMWQSDLDGNGGTWADLATDADGVKFYLADATGKILVDAHGAECSLPEFAECETSTWKSKSWCDKDEELGGYIERISPQSHPGRYRLIERNIIPNRWYEVIGTCVENPQARDEHDHNLITKGQNETTFLISRGGKKEAEQELSKRARFFIFGGAGFAIACLAVIFYGLGWL